MGGHSRTFQFNACFVAIFFFIHLLLHFSTVESGNNGGFSVKLIRKKLARKSSYSRRLMDSTVQSTSTAYLGHYLMELSIGTPPKTMYGIADTGSDLIWTQCVPCHNCYKQLNPMFDPQGSSTYSSISCESEECHNILDTTLCSSDNDQCNYTYAYASASITQGVLAHEKFTFTSTTTMSMGKPISLQGIVFGCGHSNTGGFNDHEMGIIGLGKGPASLISQLGSLFGISKRFSQCLVPFNTDINVHSMMSFGNGSEVLGDGVVSTPLVTKSDDDSTPYFVTLLGITVGDTYLPFNNTSSGTVEKGNMFIDSGTPPTILPQDLYDRVVAEMRNQIALRPIEDDHDLGSQLCYRTDTIVAVGVPVIIAHFEGADVQLTTTQLFVPPKDGVQCLGLTNTSSDGGIYGNFAQSNYLIGFDLDREIVSFKPMDCTKQ
ncbi:hypothetical protein PIB30_023813 [Stylosanthes scabra]|uniref:Peptidase A1 domain-containing protein n=1 Tax=Stylosanthes scabra TaxID=79078 RepID=A0ABU6Z9W1_9FABA|nr:hypothetical protein [Stylosanthes scabra]